MKRRSCSASKPPRWPDSGQSNSGCLATELKRYVGQVGHVQIAGMHGRVRLIDALVQPGTPFDLMTCPGARHGSSGAQAQRRVYRKIAEFFRRNVAQRQP